MTRLLSACAVLMALVGCAQTPQRPDFSAFNAAAPRSILIVPAVNKTLDVDAPNYLLATLTVPLAEKGFYVFPVNTAKTVLEQEGFYEGELVQKQPPESLAQMFGADAVLFVTISRWDAQYAVVASTVTVELQYQMFAKDGTEIWKANQKIQYSPRQQSTGSPMTNLIAAAISAAVTRAAPDYMPLARQANSAAFMTGPTAIPNGPYFEVAK